MRHNCHTILANIEIDSRYSLPPFEKGGEQSEGVEGQCHYVKPLAERSRSDFSGFGSAQPTVYLTEWHLT